jgi:hypothetical protein
MYPILLFYTIIIVQNSTKTISCVICVVLTINRIIMLFKYYRFSIDIVIYIIAITLKYIKYKI